MIAIRLDDPKHRGMEKGGTYNATNTAETVDTDLGDHNCGRFDSGEV